MSANASQPTRAHRAARLITAVYATATAVAIGRLLFGHHGRGVFWDMAFGLLNVPVASSFLAVVVLFLVTRALIGRKRVALWLIAFFQVVGIGIGILALLPDRMSPVLRLWRPPFLLGRVLDVAAMGVGVAMLTVVWWLRPLFTGRLRQGSWWLAAAAGVIGTAITSGVMWLLLGAQRDNHQRISGVIDTVTDVLSGTSHVRITGVRPWVVDVTALLAGLTLLTAITVFLASARSSATWSAEKEIAVRRLLMQYGVGDSLGYFNTRRDRSTIFSASGRSAVTYRVTAGVSLAASDPIGDRSDWLHAIEAWRAEARRYGWQPAVLAAGEDGARAYATRGMRVLRLGDEAVLDTATFSIRRPELSEVQRSAARARRSGVAVLIRRQSDIGASELSDIADSTRDWLNGVVDRGFSMALNRERDPADGRCLVVTAYRDGQLVGVLRFVPWGHRDLSLDVMRRSRQAPGGVTELMITELMRAADRLGVGRVSLNFCMFRGVFAEADRIGGRSMTKLNAGVLGVLDRFWQLERLYLATQKYHPDWVPRFLCYDDPLVLPRVALAAAAAEGFIPWPNLSDHAPEEFPPALLGQVRQLASQVVDPVHIPPVRGDQTRRLGIVQRAEAERLDPYPASGQHLVLRLRQLHEAGWEVGRVVTVSGRIRALRNHGRVVFADLIEDGCGIQLLLDAEQLPDLDRFVGLIDSGDLLSCSGTLGRSHNATPSLIVRSWRLEAKSLHPLPWKALGDPETRLPNRAADLILHPEDLEVLRQRSVAVGAVRQVLLNRGFLEVETPILQTVHGGARARPFKTRLRSLDRELNLRIAPELYLKQLLVAGFGPVFEIGRNFRNEGTDATHNPEFTSLEAYEPGGDYRTMLQLARELIIAAASAVYGKPAIPLPRENGARRWGRDADPVDISGVWPVVCFLDAVSEAVGERVGPGTDLGRLVELAERFDVVLPSRDLGAGAVLEELYAKLVEPTTVFPTFYIDFPRETSPLTRPHRTRPGLVERWDLVAAGMEIGTAYTELTDPLDQRRRLTQQSLQAVAGDPEAMELDEAFLTALELGMPPSGGLGIGIDRLIMLLTHRPIRSVLTFPFTRSAPRMP